MMEIGLIIVIAVMLFPPTELPKLVRSIARVYGQIRRTAEDFRNTVLEDEDLREPIDEIKGAYNDARWEVRDAERKARQQLAKAQMEMRMATARRIQAERETEAKQKTDEPEAQSGSGESSSSAASAGPVRIAADAPDDDEDEHDDDDGGPVAAADPRKLGGKLVAPRPSPAPAEPSSEPREGVA